MVAAAVLQKRHPETEPETEAVVAADTTVLSSEEAAEADTITAPTKPRTQKTSETTSTAASKDDIDALFREATGLFE